MDLLIKLSMLVVFFSVTIGIGLYWRGAAVLSVWVSFIFSTVVMLDNIFVRSSFLVILQSSINAGAFCMLAGLVLVPVITLFAPKPDKAHLDHIFSCYEKKVTVTVRDSIGDSSDN